MTLYGIVDQVSGKLCRVCLADEACGHDCEACAGCSRKNKGRLMEAENDIGALVGDRVEIHAPESSIIPAAFLVFLLPIALMTLGYAIGKYLLDMVLVGVAMAVLGATLGVLICVLYAKKVGKKSSTVYRVSRILTEEEE
ncbi:MAG: SoxR reducing system RseC family protein [Clostridia bacterium]|nr:SoxR reducing system RseC family protein [Clostridia bacterium]